MRSRIRLIAVVLLAIALAVGGAGLAGAKKKRKHRSKPHNVHAARTTMRIVGFVLSPTQNPQIAAIIKAKPRVRACIANRVTDLHIVSPAGDRIAAQIAAPPGVGKDASALVGASFPIRPDDQYFYLDVPVKQVGPVTCGAVRGAPVIIPLPF